MRVWAGNMWRMSMAVFLGLAVMLGCAGSGIRTLIHQDETTRVYLEWVPQDSFRATHPAVLSPTVIRRTLRGLRVQQQEPGLDELLAGLPEPQRILSDEDVELLTPHILLALSSATSEEHVVFQRIYPWKYGSRTTGGTLYLQEKELFLTITHYTPHPGGVGFAYIDNRHAPDPTGFRNQTLFFIPKEAVRPYQSLQYPQHLNEATVAINYPFLETWSESAERPNLPLPRQEEGASQGESTEVAPEEPASQDPPIRALDEQVQRQERELDQLKKELRELQQRPERQ